MSQSPDIPVNPKRPRNEQLRGLFRVLIGFALLAYAFSLTWHWFDARRDAETQLRYIRSTLVENTRTTLRNYELVLRGLGSELVALGALDKPSNGRALIERMGAIDPGMAGLGLARPNGQLLLVTGVPDDTALPNLLQQAETRDSFRKSLSTGHLQIGRPYFMPLLKLWVSPVRVPIVDAQDKIIAVMTAGYSIDGGTALLANTVLPPDVDIALLRDDHYVQHLQPLPAGPRQAVYERVYQRPVHPKTIQQVAALHSSKGITTIDLPRLNGRHYVAYERIDEYGLTAAAFVPCRTIVFEWLQRIVLPTLLLLACLIGGTLIYRRALIRQSESDAVVGHLLAWQKAVLDGADYSIISTDTAGTIVSFNAAAERMLGYSADEMIGKANPEIFHDPDEVRQRAAELSQELGEPIEPGFDVFVAKARRGGADEREWLHLHKDGSPFPVRLSITALHGPSGEIEGFLGIAADLTEQKQAQASLRDSLARYRILFEHAGDSIFLMQGDLFVDCNPATLDMFGCTREQIIGTTPYRFSPPFQADGRPSQEAALEKIGAAFAGQTQVFEWQHQRLDGKVFDAEVTLNIILIDGQPHILATVRNISQRKKAEAELAQSRQALIEGNESLRLINRLSTHLHASLALDDILKEAMNALLGLSHAPNIAIYLQDAEGAQLDLVASHGFDPSLLRQITRISVAGSLCGLALTHQHALVSEHFAADERLQAGIRNALDAAGLHAGVSIPITYNKQALGCLSLLYREHKPFSETELETLNAFSNAVALAIANSRHVISLAFQALHDSLTLLPNRTVLHQELIERFERQPGKTAALLLLDLDRFKEINDTLGHHIGDQLLTGIGPRLEQTLAGLHTLICRLGGDEFAILLTGLDDRNAVVEWAQHLTDALRRPFMIEGIALQIGGSIGVAFYPEHGDNSHALLRAADVAMYQAKKLAAGVVVYDRSYDTHSPERLALAGELTQALQNDEMVLHYQPKLDIASRQIIGFEALARWQNPRLGMLYPDAFIHLVEMNEVIHPFTQTILHLALTDKRRLHDLGYTQPVAINLSARNLMDGRFVAHLEHAIVSFGLPHQEVELELTETALMHDPDSSVALLRSIAATGVNIAVDDFGTGYSSLAYLRRLPLSALKIDRSFVMGMADNSQDATIVRSTIAMAHGLGLKVIAEGVESAKLLGMLKEMGCDQAQGYYLSRPLPLDELIAWLGQTAPLNA
ncbi:EAL domain-containing protein [Thiobacillus sp.]|uniref:bifunctional diguanylate cyclase/phosphodiesterase n=1 Tax=Thiobacillus sp. TaxID=924 RepID=UPI00286D6EE8|nr:EAL domain-containing protein [Thiobacillus sp.]